MPIWYHYRPGGDLWVLTPPQSRKAALITAAGRFSVLVHQTSPSNRYVSVEGRLIETRPATAEEVSSMASRYLPDEAIAAYVDFARHEHLFRMRPEHWLSSDLSSS